MTFGQNVSRETQRRYRGQKKKENVSRETGRVEEVNEVKEAGEMCKGKVRKNGQLLDIFGLFSYHKIHCEEGKR